MSKSIKIKRINDVPCNASAVTKVLDDAKVTFESIDTVNWVEFPYKPDVSFRAAHTGNALILQYRCTEEAVRAVAEGDNGAVWEDSCVEFFVSFDGKKYYNVECNCVGTILSACGEGRETRRQASLELLDKVQRHSSLSIGNLPSDGPVSWEVSLIIPVATFFGSGISNLSGVTATCNFYKCGDKLPTPHFLSWNPIDVPNPDFHRPEYFGRIEFE